MFFEDHQTLFFHIGKTAGTSVEQAFLPGARDVRVADYSLFFGYEQQAGFYLQHATPAFMRAHMDRTVFETCFKFTVVRNPFTRLYSVFNYSRKWQNPDMSFETFVEDLPTLLRERQFIDGHHLKSQTSYTHLDDAPICDEVLYFEELPDCFDRIRAVTGLERALPHTNRTREKSHTDSDIALIYTPAMVDIVTHCYKSDFDVLGYSNDPRRIAPMPRWRRRLFGYPKSTLKK